MKRWIFRFQGDRYFSEGTHMNKIKMELHVPTTRKLPAKGVLIAEAGAPWTSPNCLASLLANGSAKLKVVIGS